MNERTGEGPMVDSTVDVNRMPRIEPLLYEEVDEKTRQAWDELRPPPGGPTQKPGQEHDLFRIGMHHPDLMRVHQPFVQFVKNSTVLPIRHRELAIMRSAWLGGVDDQFVNHTKIGMECGLARDEIDRIPAGADAPGWSAEDAAILRAVDELHFSCRISDHTWADLARQYDDRQLLELLLLVGNYRTLSYLQNSIGIRPVTGNSPNIPGNHFLFLGA
ncbi:MAG TPA: carboxymuconolactone decarboxylase family protein [Acidimicrobiales bacterium]|nr:carboxymuconolactone decarboxylase family protein [Acidimicrobiales bacterium]